MNIYEKLKAISLILVFLFFALWGGIIYIGEVSGQNLESIVQPTPLPSPTPLPTPVYVPSNPVIVSIPKISISAYIEPVGVDNDGRMDVPKKDEDVAWYSQGFKPGEKGSAVFAGHLDKVTGAPAVFWDLAKLDSGDEIFVTDEKNQTIKFVVTSKQKYIYNEVPLDQIFDSKGEVTLNLITCGGTFNQAARNYSHRIIVSARQAGF